MCGVCGWWLTGLIGTLYNKPDFNHNLPVSLKEPQTKATHVALWQK